MNELVYWIWLSLCCTPDTSTFSKLIYDFTGPKDIFEAEEKEISRSVGFKNSDRSRLFDKDLDKAKSIYDFCVKHKVGILTYADPKYPNSLRDISTPPVLLYYRGILPDFNNRFFVAAVGTRSLSDYGRRNSFKICFDLASAGAVIVSGMAMGIDGVSLAGALEAGGNTVAVLGSGIDVCYPAQHLTLAREIVKNGCVMTEYAPGTPPNKFNFPKRNRIISGLCSATIVFEGRERSGSLITARYAKEQGRTVFALPGNVGTAHSEASGVLLKNGGLICTKAEDVLDPFLEVYGSKINPFNMSKTFGVNIMNSLTKYGVAATSQGDSIFVPARSTPKETNKVQAKKTEESVSAQKESKTESDISNAGLSREAMKIYKKIPLKGSCSVESLVDDEIGLRDVMKALLKLEINHFVVMLPGEMVSRKFK